MFIRSELKEIAKRQLKDNFLGCLFWLFLVPLIEAVLIYQISDGFKILSQKIIDIPITILIFLFLTTISGLFTNNYLLHMINQEGKVDLTCGYKDLTFKKISSYMWIRFYTFCFMYFSGSHLILIIPGIIMAYMIYFAPLIVLEHQDWDSIRIFKHSELITRHHKFDIFILELSFLLWLLLIVISFGLASIWVLPYIQLTIANCYKKLKQQAEEKSNSEIDNNKIEENSLD